MLKRDLSKLSPTQRKLYADLIQQATQLFEGKQGKLTVFHEIIIDRVVDAYISVLRTEDVDAKLFSEKKYKVSQEKLQKWLTMIFAELHSVEKEMKVRQQFFQRCIEILDNLVPDDHLKKEILVQMKYVVEGGL